MPCLPDFFVIGLYLESLKNKCDICHVLCEEFFMLHVTHSHVDILIFS